MSKTNDPMHPPCVLFQGAFDVIHAGHVRVLKTIKEKYPDHVLTVALNTDSLIAGYKNARGPIMPYQERAEILRGIRYVDVVVPADNFSPKNLLEWHKVEVYALIGQWQKDHAELIRWMKDRGCEVYLAPTFDDVMRSSDVRQKIIKRGN